MDVVEINYAKSTRLQRNGPRGAFVLVHLPEELAALLVPLDGIQFRAAHVICTGELDNVLYVGHLGHRNACHGQGPHLLTSWRRNERDRNKYYGIDINSRARDISLAVNDVGGNMSKYFSR